MTTRILPTRPRGLLFKDAAITVVRINPEPFIQDYDQNAIDLALREFQTAMFGQDEQDLSMVRDYLDMFQPARFWQIGLKVRRRRKRGTFSDFALAVAMLHQSSPFGLAYTWPPSHAFPDGLTLVFYRGHTYERHGDLLHLRGA